MRLAMTSLSSPSPRRSEHQLSGWNTDSNNELVDETKASSRSGKSVSNKADSSRTTCNEVGSLGMNTRERV